MKYWLILYAVIFIPLIGMLGYGYYTAEYTEVEGTIMEKFAVPGGFMSGSVDCLVLTDEGKRFTKKHCNKYVVDDEVIMELKNGVAINKMWLK